MTALWINSAFDYLRRNPTQNMYGREMVGDVVPHIIIARTRDERIDTSVIQLTNTLLPITAGYGLDKLYGALQKRIQLTETALARQWSVLGKSFAMFAVLAAIPISNAFIRNWVTTRRSGTVGFIDMVGEKAHTRDKKAVKNRLAHYKRSIAGILGGGAAISAGLFALTQLAIRKKWAFGKLPGLLSKYLAMPEGRFENFDAPVRKLFGTVSLAPVLIWGIPIYAGLFSASRDQFEFKELVLRFATFLASFFVLPKVAKAAAEKWTPKPLSRLLGSPANAAIVVELAATSVMFAILPPLVNIVLTRQRVAKEKEKLAWKQANLSQLLTHPKLVTNTIQFNVTTLNPQFINPQQR